ncbi:hypothetical protein AB1Y20_001175 [Prymnesium parvum]|uniref:Peptidase C1A papain C-terminal domain-containing protein n=1 Tax=Prymnesium parvum TaxID=97485 RepID=A0AB34KCT8_PRYPA
MFALFLSMLANAPAAHVRHPRGFVRQPKLLGETIFTHNLSQAELDAAPVAIDWSARGAVSEVKDQGQCGSCWAFSTTEGVESAVFRVTGTLPPALSTEELVDCEKKDDGCDGGDIPEAVRYLQRKGMAYASDYPDDSSKSGKTQQCTWTGKYAVDVKGFQYAVPQCSQGDCSNLDEARLAAALAKFGPLSICINSGEGEPGDWDKYEGGVWTKQCSAKASKIDHCVQLVGYDKNATIPYWKVRNSWGTGWGEEGYIRLPYNAGNACCLGCEAITIDAAPATVEGDWSA